MKTIFAVIGAAVTFLWLAGMMGVGDFVVCFGPHDACVRYGK